MDPSPEGTGHDNFLSYGSSKNQKNKTGPYKIDISSTHIWLYVRKDLPDSILRGCNYPLQGIQFLQINAQYPSRLTKLIMFKCFLGRLKPCDGALAPKNIDTFYIQRIYLLLIESSLCSSLDPLFHSDSIINRVNAEEMNAFSYY